ncbi:MAG: carbohydrate kinase [Verrucomicrobia bacterium]|nr:carbohydrate kinase [Verrucomicrobiota bacterium]
MSEGTAKPIICFGEILWDSLPRGLFPGGAPMNVAYHLQQLGSHPIPVTAVGRDSLGEELLQRLKTWGVDTSGVSVHPTKPTGLARVTVVDGGPRFEIVEDVAWDWIELSVEVMEHAPQSAAVVFGSLAQRSEYNRQSLADLLDHCPTALKVFDVNLRPPYHSAERVWALAQRADLIKLNDHELISLLNESAPPADLAEAVRRFSKRAGVGKVCLTAGAAGAGLLLDGEWFWESAKPVSVRDTVGAGDSFLAALLFGLLQGINPPAEILRRACRLAEVVVTRDGATPAYHLDEFGNVRVQ